MELLIAALVIGLLPATIAYRKGRSFILWWLFGAILFIVALPLALLSQKDREALDRRATAHGDMMKCPLCAEVIRSEARVCKHCGRDVVPGPVATSA